MKYDDRQHATFFAGVVAGVVILIGYLRRPVRFYAPVIIGYPPRIAT